MLNVQSKLNYCLIANNPLGISSNVDKIYFHPYFTVKDIFFFFLFLLIFAFLVFYTPNYLGQGMAISIWKYCYCYDAICWNNLFNNNTRIISAFFLLPYSVKIFLFKDQSAGNQNSNKELVGSSETTRVIPKKEFKRNLNESNFNYWLSGIIEGDGTFYINKQGNCNFEITLDSKDIQTLYYIKKSLGWGNISKRSKSGAKGSGLYVLRHKSNAYRLRTSKEKNILDLLNRINNKVLTLSKQKQLSPIYLKYNIIFLIPNKKESLNIIKNTSWLSGFFDAEGFFNIMNKSTLAFHIGQKDKNILNLIYESLLLGHIRYDKSTNFWIYSITDKEGIRFILNQFKIFPLHTQKNSNIFTFNRLLYFIDNKYHLQNHLNHSKWLNLIKSFKEKI